MRVRLLALAALFLALYSRSLGWDWLRMDDSLLLERNPNLGHGLQSYWWALTDVEFGRRWTPLFWVLAQAFSGFGVVGYHLGTLLVGLGLSLSVFVMFRAVMAERYAFVLAAVFIASPLRMEIFAWSIGFLYSATALVMVWAVIAYQNGRHWWSLICLAVALLLYPQAAGLCLVFLWLWRTRPQGAVLFLGLLALLWIQMHLRVTSGFIPFAPDARGAAWVLPHYFGAALVPLVTMPIVPAGFYWLLLIPVGLLALIAAGSSRTVFLWAAVALPTVLASVTESFWYGARYSTFLSIAVLWSFGLWLQRRVLFVDLLTGESLWERDRRVVPLLWVVVGLLAIRTVQHTGFRSERDAAQMANAECMFLYGHPVAFSRPYGL